MKIKKAVLPVNSLMNNSTLNYHFVDCFQGTIEDRDNKITSFDVGKAFFTGGPSWIGMLFTLRNKIVSLFGLKTSGDITNRESQLKNFKCEPGERLGLFRVFDRTKNEVILGEDDKHLNFRVSLFLSPKTEDSSKRILVVSTVVQFNNWFGRLYFFPVKPFHKLIVPTMLKGMIKELESRAYKKI
jgi:hypothetical protein